MKKQIKPGLYIVSLVDKEFVMGDQIDLSEMINFDKFGPLNLNPKRDFVQISSDGLVTKFTFGAFHEAMRSGDGSWKSASVSLSDIIKERPNKDKVIDDLNKAATILALFVAGLQNEGFTRDESIDMAKTFIDSIAKGVV